MKVGLFINNGCASEGLQRWAIISDEVTFETRISNRTLTLRFPLKQKSAKSHQILANIEKCLQAMANLDKSWEIFSKVWPVDIRITLGMRRLQVQGISFMWHFDFLSHIRP